MVWEMAHERNLLLIEFLQYLGAGLTTAKENACSMEHVLSDEVFEIIRRRSQSSNHCSMRKPFFIESGFFDLKNIFVAKTSTTSYNVFNN